MGLFFNLFIETDRDRLDELANYFRAIITIETSFGVHQLNIAAAENSSGITISVHETGHTGLGDSTEKTIATEVGHRFYELLKNAPPFRCAMVGVEAGEWFDEQSILDPNFDGYLPIHGLVIRDDIELQLNEAFVPFKEGYSWTPYLGEVNE